MITRLSPKQSWPALIESANLYLGYERFKLNHGIYELGPSREGYRFAFSLSYLTKKDFINYVMSDERDTFEDEYQSSYNL